MSRSPALAALSPRRMLHLPPRTVRLRLTALYSSLFLISGTVLLAFTYLVARRATVPNLVVPIGDPEGSSGARELSHALANPELRRYVQQVAVEGYTRSLDNRAHDLHQLLVWSGIALAIMTVVSIALGWLVAGRVLRPLQAITATTRQISERNLSERLAVPGPRDELKDLGDTIDGLLTRIEAHVAEQQRFAANASHELRTPLAVTQTLLDVARKDPKGDGELVERLHAVNTRAIDLTEALLLLTRADQGSLARENVDLSLIVEEAAETLLTLAEERGLTIETTGATTPTTGSHALLLQMVTNLMHNAVVHNLPEGGSVLVTTSNHSDRAVLTVENTGAKLTEQLVSTLHEPFQHGARRIRTDHGGVGLGLAIVKRITEAHDGVLSLTPRADGGLRVTVELPASGPAGLRPAA